MLAHLALATALMVAATHLAPEPPGSPSPVPSSRTSAVIFTAAEVNAGEPGRCTPANARPAYRDLSDMALIPPASPATFGHPGPHP